jgi:hypothetical protein
MSVGTMWAAFRRRCDEDPDYLSRKRREWEQAADLRIRMESWGCYNCAFLQNMVGPAGELTDGCYAIEIKGSLLTGLCQCPIGRPKRGRQRRRVG